ncbi:unnamed protein product [Rhizoctonia solani]|uniref:Iminophenyl-pyruvate dimer synthase domain-containing protein n=1 Tax=Rhizoctonia solani TaxID=456999 RepID=A0A8H3E2Y0_9AGAM|nr:unnamed protein product [Rhizoctonia solani]
MGDRPKGPPDPWTPDDLKKHLQTAVTLELCTIPVYLYALYAINPDPQDGTDEDKKKAKKIAKDTARNIQRVVKEEMLHLGLAGNILSSIGTRPELYGPERTPKYELEMFYEPITLHLVPPHEEAIQTFVQLEAPQQETPGHSRGPGWEVDRYQSIGEFYESLEKGLETIHEEMKKKGNALFDPECKDRQFTGRGMIEVKVPDNASDKELKKALAAMKLIVAQGEGTKTKTRALTRQKKSHWEIFEELTKVQIPHHDTVTDPKTDDQTFSEKIKKAMRAFDAVYCYLLLSIENVWANVTGDQRTKLLENVTTLMGGMMQPIALFLVEEKVNDAAGSKRAAPPFNYYHFESIESAKDEMIKELKAAHEAYATGGFDGLVEEAKGLLDLKELTCEGEPEEAEEAEESEEKDGN